MQNIRKNKVWLLNNQDLIDTKRTSELSCINHPATRSHFSDSISLVMLESSVWTKELNIANSSP